MNNKIDKIFREKLRDLEKTPSANVWERLSNGIEEREKRKRLAFWYSLAAAIAILLMSSIILFQFIRNDRTISNTVVTLEKIEKKSPQRQIESVKPMESITFLPTIKDRTTFKNAEKRALEIDSLASRTHSYYSITEKEIKEINDSETPIPPAEDQVYISENPDGDNLNSREEISVIIKRRSSVAHLVDSTKENHTVYSKLGRAYNQLLNLKNGEKVDLKEFSNLLATNKKEK